MATGHRARGLPRRPATSPGDTDPGHRAGAGLQRRLEDLEQDGVGAVQRGPLDPLIGLVGEGGVPRAEVAGGDAELGEAGDVGPAQLGA